MKLILNTRSAGFRAGLAVFISLPMAALARGQAPLSPRLTGPIGDTGSIYSESSINGPSSSLTPGDTNLTNPFNRAGINDPLQFSIETGAMSPYHLGAFSDSYADDSVFSGILNDPLIALQFGEYRNNRALMAGAGYLLRSTVRSTAAAGPGGSFGASHAPGSESAFGRSQQPFGAGSSLVSAATAAASNSDAGMLDPNALALAASNPALLAGINQSGDGEGAAGAPGISAVLDPEVMSLHGPEPGQLFPNLSNEMSSGTGFEDSTVGTTGSGLGDLTSDASPLLSPLANGEGTSPFASLSSGEVAFLHPSLRGAVASQAARPTLSDEDIHEQLRRYRLRQIIEDPAAPPLSPFEARKLERAYMNQHNGNQRPSRTPSIIATTR